LKLSIIIPTLNEAEVISDLIRHIHRVIFLREYEILICDGGSRDETRTLAIQEGARVIESGRKRRSIQMNRGAEAARGDILYFLHADTLPPKHFDLNIRQALQKGYDAGCFRLKFDYEHPFLRLISWFTRFNIDIFRFGDQSLFLYKSLFDNIRGFNEDLVVMEDQDIIHRIRKGGGKFTLLPKSVITSARRYREVGIVRLQFIFFLIWGLYYCGASQEVLVQIYKSMMNKEDLPNKS
jgi:rSAM/selenodomain-associated transferase 2